MEYQRHRLLVPAAVAILLVCGVSQPVPAQRQPSATAKGATVSTDVQSAIIRRLYEVALNEDRLDLLPELVTPGFINHNLNSPQQTGVAAYVQSIRQTRTMFSHPRFTLDDIIVSGDKAAVRWTMTATNTGAVGGPANAGKPITQHAIVIYRFEEGKIAEAWLQLDRLSISDQLGLTPPGNRPPSPTVAR